MSEFVPLSFTLPREVTFGRYILRPLMAVDVEMDCAAVNENIDLIRRLRGGRWPQAAITIEEDLGDLQEHERQFQEREAFAYIILDQEDVLSYGGCLYVYPPHHPFDDTDQSNLPMNADAAVSFWVTSQTYDRGDYSKLYQFIEQWLTEDWPFNHPYIVNAEKP